MKSAEKKLRAIEDLLEEPFANHDLTPREKQVAKLAALEGMTYREIAAELVVSDETARSHLQNVTSKLDVSKAEIIRLFVERLRKVVTS